MKGRIFFVLFIMCGSLIMAQQAKVVSAYNYNKSYERDKECSELVKGIAAIESASKNAKTSLYTKTWYYGGNLYFNAALTADTACSKQFEDALEKCYEYYLTSLKFNVKEEGTNEMDLSEEQNLYKLLGYINNRDTKFEDFSYIRDILGQKFPLLSQAFINLGVKEFNNQNLAKAKEYSEKSIEVNIFLGRVDTLGMFNAALTSERLGQTDDAIKYYTSLTKINYGGAQIYLYLGDLYLKKGDTAKKMEVIKDGLEVYPEDTDLLKEELSYLLSKGKTEEALANFDKAIASDENNPTLYFNRGVIFDELREIEKATKDYEKALEVDPTFFDAAYNLGAMYYNLGVEKNKEAGTYGLKEQDKFEAAEAKAKELFAKALPALEKAHNLEPDDKSTMTSLLQVYAIVGNTEGYNAIKAKMGGQ